MAKGLLGTLAAMIIREATVSSQASREMLRLTRIENAELKPMRRSNSVDSLSPKSRFQRIERTTPPSTRIAAPFVALDVGPTTLELTVTALPVVVSANPRAKAICMVFVTP
ncbi:MAG: hypothetical protein JOZ21_02865 [Verrucomicrobia bacterium]|nr:hypothetical protein [Verrucomicrobiota bacterium]